MRRNWWHFLKSIIIIPRKTVDIDLRTTDLTSEKVELFRQSKACSRDHTICSTARSESNPVNFSPSTFVESAPSLRFVNFRAYEAGHHSCKSHGKCGNSEQIHFRRCESIFAVSIPINIVKSFRNAGISLLESED
jgi:hypothetical protein